MNKAIARAADILADLLFPDPRHPRRAAFRACVLDEMMQRRREGGTRWPHFGYEWRQDQLETLYSYFTGGTAPPTLPSLVTFAMERSPLTGRVRLSTCKGARVQVPEYEYFESDE